MSLFDRPNFGKISCWYAVMFTPVSGNAWMGRLDRESQSPLERAPAFLSCGLRKFLLILEYLMLNSALISHRYHFELLSNQCILFCLATGAVMLDKDAKGLPAPQFFWVVD
jgi:hypothetical protein